jgi:hypothetical protein
MNNTIHIYGQKSFHDDVWIVSNREGLKELYCAIREALASNKKDTLRAFVNDGEGYEIHIKIDDRVNSCSSKGKYSVPYYADFACEKREDAIYPWTKDTII